MSDNKRRLKVLSIDFDYFQNVDVDTIRNCYPDGIDLSTKLSSIVWAGYYANDKTKCQLGNVTILDDELNKLRRILTSRNNTRVSTPVLITNSHVHIYDFIHKHARKFNATDVNIVNIDMHHDLFNNNPELDCGNWLSHIHDDFKDHCNISWIANPISKKCYDFNETLNRIVLDSIDSIRDCKFDIIFLCRSDNWLAPHLDTYFNDLVKLISLRFANVNIEECVMNPRNITSLAQSMSRAQSLMPAYSSIVSEQYRV